MECWNVPERLFVEILAQLTKSALCSMSPVAMDETFQVTLAFPPPTTTLTFELAFADASKGWIKAHNARHDTACCGFTTTCIASLSMPINTADAKLKPVTDYQYWLRL